MGLSRAISLLAIAARAASLMRSAPLPNLVMALTDDLGWNSPGFHNPTIISPTLDRLASEGVKLARHYTSVRLTCARPFDPIGNKFRPNPPRWSSRTTADLHQPPFRATFAVWPRPLGRQTDPNCRKLTLFGCFFG